MFEENLKMSVLLVHISLQMHDYHYELRYFRKRISNAGRACVLEHLFLQIASTLKRVKFLKKQVNVFENHRLQTVA